MLKQMMKFVTFIYSIEVLTEKSTCKIKSLLIKNHCELIGKKFLENFNFNYSQFLLINYDSFHLERNIYCIY